MKTKEELIKKAYGKWYYSLQNQIDEWGWLFMSVWDLETNYPDLYSSTPFTIYGNKVRPISLSRIEENNGWFKMTSYKDIMKQKPVLVYTNKGNVYEYSHYTAYFGICETEDIIMYKPIDTTKPLFV